MHKGIRQTTMTLPYFNHDVPVLYDGEDEMPYVPVIALCQMLGIRADTRIPRWRKMLLWEDARKLPVRLPARGRRVVWCIPAGAIAFLLSYFDWSSVSSERRAQLHQMTEASMNRLDTYQQLRPLLFLFLTRRSGAERILRETAAGLSPTLEMSSSKRLEVLVNLGCTYLQEVTTHARNILHEQGQSLIVDAVQIDAEGNASDAFSLPLFPVMPRQEDIEQFLLYGQQLLHWYDDFHAFLEEHGFPRTPLV